MPSNIVCVSMLAWPCRNILPENVVERAPEPLGSLGGAPLVRTSAAASASRSAAQRKVFSTAILMKSSLSHRSCFQPMIQTTARSNGNIATCIAMIESGVSSCGNRKMPPTKHAVPMVSIGSRSMKRVGKRSPTMHIPIMPSTKPPYM